MVFLRTRLGRRNSRDEQGAVAVLTAFLMVGLMIMAAIVVDLGMARDVRRQSQNASDAASLAGTAALYPDALSSATPSACLSGPVTPPCITDAVAAVKTYASNNFQVDPASGWSACTAALPTGYVASAASSCISYNSATRPTKVRVVLPTRTLRTFFGAVTGRSSIPVGSSAEAVVTPQVTCSLCFLGNVDAGNGDYTVTGGSIAVNGNVDAQSNSVWNSSSNGVSGTVSGGAFTPPPVKIDPFGDPLAGLTPLNTTGPPTLQARTDPCTLPPTGGPGLYGAFSLPNSACTLQPGLYVISGKWDMKNNTVLKDLGAGVTLYAKSSSPYASSSSGYLDFKNGDVIITASSTGVGAGYAIIYDSNNTNDIGLQGNGNTLIAGMVYAPASRLEGNGNSCFGLSGGPFVFGGAYTNGNPGCVTVTNAHSIEVTAKGLHLNQ